MLKTMWKEWKVSAFHHNIWVYFPFCSSFSPYLGFDP